jgi:hypothetical protein
LQLRDGSDSLVYPTVRILRGEVGLAHHPRREVPWCAWCGGPVAGGVVVVAGAVIYHEFCWALRARLLGLIDTL